MAILRPALGTALKTTWFTHQPCSQHPLKMSRKHPIVALVSAVSNRHYSRHTLSKSLELISVDNVEVVKQKSPPLLVTEKRRPLVVMLAWMLAKKQHLNKYAEVYLKRGYDVLTVHITPWQLMWPVNGTQVVADEVLQFLHHNSVCQPLVLHGFSVGGYVWGEVMVRMKQDLERYQHVIDRIIGQAWDSAADVTEIHIGLPLAIFPKNPILRTALEKYVRYHLKTFHAAATIHYLRSSQLFHTNLVHSPALLLVSKSDPVGSVSSNLRVRDTWRSMGIKTYWKCWDDSKHVSHFLKYRSDYIQTLEAFLDSLKDGQEDSLLQEKIQAKL